MRNKILSVCAAGALLAACECAPDTEVSVTSGMQPGTEDDFKAHVPDRIFFDFNKHHVTEESKVRLEAQAGWLKTYPSATAVIEGHCDSRGTREYNLALGAHRAHAAEKALVHMGVDSKRLKTVSFGKDEPVVPENGTEEAYAQNRVAITVVNPVS